MATKKQRRRREKEKRHEYEIVYLDSEGNEVEPEDAAEPPRSARNGSTPKRQQRGSAPGGRRGQPQPPSWARVGKRSAMFAPAILAVLLLIGHGRISIATAVVQTLLFTVIFVPFAYFLDTLLWRNYQKRQAGGSKSRR